MGSSIGPTPSLVRVQIFTLVFTSVLSVLEIKLSTEATTVKEV